MALALFIDTYIQLSRTLQKFTVSTGKQVITNVNIHILSIKDLSSSKNWHFTGVNKMFENNFGKSILLIHCICAEVLFRM